VKSTPGGFWPAQEAGCSRLRFRSVFSALLARNLVGARGMPVVVAHAWVALAVTALLLVGAFAFGIAPRVTGIGAIGAGAAAAAVHVRLPPTPSALTAARPLAIHFRCRLAALALLAVAVIADSAWTVRLAAAVGTAGALAFANFFVVALRRMQVTAAR